MEDKEKKQKLDEKKLTPEEIIELINRLVMELSTRPPTGGDG